MSVGTAGTGCPHATAAAGHGGSEFVGGGNAGMPPPVTPQGAGGSQTNPWGLQHRHGDPAAVPCPQHCHLPGASPSSARRGHPPWGPCGPAGLGRRRRRQGGGRLSTVLLKSLRQQEGEGPSERHSAVQGYGCSLLPAVISSISPTGGNPQPRHPPGTTPAAPGVPGCDVN